MDCGAAIPVVFLMNLKSIFRAIARELGFFMTSNEKQRKEKFFANMRTSERIDKDGKKILVVEEMEQIPCPMHEDYDDVDYKAADHLDEVAAIERMRKDK